MYYVSDWPCNVNIQDSPGEIASPHWPEQYPSNLQCLWRLTAPLGQRVRIQFTDFNLDLHSLGHCNDRVDHVRLIDGGSTSAPPIGLFCGQANAMKRLVVLSTSRDLLIQFQSDRISANASSVPTDLDREEVANRWQRGFHAVFSFEPINGTLDDDVIDSSRYIDISSGRRGLPDIEGSKSDDDGKLCWGR